MHVRGSPDDQTTVPSFEDVRVKLRAPHPLEGRFVVPPATTDGACVGHLNGNIRSWISAGRRRALVTAFALPPSFTPEPQWIPLPKSQRLARHWQTRRSPSSTRRMAQSPACALIVATSLSCLRRNYAHSVRRNSLGRHI